MLLTNKFCLQLEEERKLYCEFRKQISARLKKGQKGTSSKPLKKVRIETFAYKLARLKELHQV